METQKAVVTVNPFRCRMWSLHDRLEEYVTEETCKAEIESFQKHGQLVPVLGRPVRGDDQFDLELVYGARRLFVAKHLNQPLRVEVRELTDLEAIVAMEVENRHRKDVSPYERGLSYARLLRSNHFQSQDELAHVLRVSASQVSRLLKLVRLPAVIVAAFGDPLQICEGWGMDLVDAWDGPHRALLARVARNIVERSPRPSPREVYAELMSAGLNGKRRRPTRRDEVILGDRGQPLYRIRANAKGSIIVLPQTVSPAALDCIRKTIANILQDANRYGPDAAKLSRARVSSIATQQPAPHVAAG